MGSEKSILLFNCLSELEVEYITKLISKLDSVLNEGDVYNYFTHYLNAPFSVKKKYIDEILRNETELKFLLSELKRKSKLSK